MENKEEIQEKINWKSMIVLPLLLMYVEVIFHIAVFGEISRFIIHPILFALAIGFVLGTITRLLPKLGNVILTYLILLIACGFDIVQLIYYKIFGTFLSLVSVQGAENAMNFHIVMWEQIRKNAGWIFALLIPIILVLLCQILEIKIFDRGKMKEILLQALISVIVILLSVFGLNIYGRKAFSPYDLFYNRFVLELSMNKLGVAVTTVQDAKELLFGSDQNQEFELQDSQEWDGTDSDSLQDGVEEDSNKEPDSATGFDADIAGEEPQEIVYDYQIDRRVNLTKLYNEAENEKIKNLIAYLSTQKPTKKNEYTGRYKGYNVVFVTAESLAPYGISDACTPTLNKIMNQGIVVDNFYNPLWYHSTIDGEYVNCLGQYPCSSNWSFYKSADTYQPYALGNALKSEGYTAKAYHDFTFYYYDRAKTHANMGYEFKAIDYGLEIPYNSPYSDLDTMEAVYKEFIDEEPFVMYFMSFSGHLPYNYGGNAMCVKNREVVENALDGKNLSQEAIAYIAAQVELDRALGFLMKELEKANKLDKTLFVVASDHYPYGLDNSTIDELSEFQLDRTDVANDHFELHRSQCGIWCSDMEETVHIEKLTASVDILPTVLNLLGVTYDSRLLAGRDMLSESEELVIFSDHSFMTDKLIYNARTGSKTYLVDESALPENYLENMIRKVDNKLSMSNQMIDLNFFEYIYK